MGVGHRPRFAGRDVLLGRRAPDVGTREQFASSQGAYRSTSCSGASNPIFLCFMRNLSAAGGVTTQVTFSIFAAAALKKRPSRTSTCRDARTMGHQRAMMLYTRIGGDLSKIPPQSSHAVRYFSLH